MNRIRLFLCLSLLYIATGATAVFADSCCSDDCSNDCSTNCTTLYLPRSQGENLVRHAAYRHFDWGADCWYVDFGVTYEYQQSFNGGRIARALFGPAVQSPGNISSTSTSTSSSSSSFNDCCSDNCDSDGDCKTLNFVGAQVANRNNQRDLLAEQFGLSPQTNASLKVCPEIQNHILDFQLFFGLNEICEGLWFQINIPYVHSEWTLFDDDCSDSCPKPSATPSTISSVPFNAGCMDAVSAGPITPASSLRQALGGTFNFGDKTVNTNWQRISFCECDDDKVADVHMNLGYTFYQCPDYHVGAYLRVVAPTGTEIGCDQDCKQNLFAPVIGNGDHWQLGAGLTAHAELCNWDEDRSLGIYFQGHVTHMFDECSIRTLDFNDKCLSRFLLLKRFDANNNYDGALVPAANVTTRSVDVEIDVQGQAILELLYTHGCFSAGLGYNIWGKDDEDVCINNRTINGNFGIKGCAPVAAQCFDLTGEVPVIEDTTVDETPILNTTQSAATAFACGAVDNPQFVDNNTTSDDFCANPCQDLSAIVAGADPTSADLAAIRAQNSVPPVLISGSDLDAGSAAVPSQVSHKIFAHLGYSFDDTDFMPYVRLGGSVEFAEDDRPATLEQWGIFLQAGLSF